jgi:phosphoribosylglycinamide formyltransferase-1
MTSEPELEFVSEAIKPVVETADSNAMAAGGPGLPREFIWRGEAVRIAAVLRTWRETGSCRHGSSESYVRKHWFEVRTASGRKAQIYFERQPRSHGKAKRWWLYTIEKGRQDPTADSTTPS